MWPFRRKKQEDILEVIPDLPPTPSPATTEIMSQCQAHYYGRMTELLAQWKDADPADIPAIHAEMDRLCHDYVTGAGLPFDERLLTKRQLAMLNLSRDELTEFRDLAHQ